MRSISKGIVSLIAATMLLAAGEGIVPNTVNASMLDSAKSSQNSQESSRYTWQSVKLTDGTEMQILPDNSSKLAGKIKYNGQIYSYRIVSNNGVYTIYLNNEEVYSVDINNSQLPTTSVGGFDPFINFTYANGKVAFKHAGRKYYYLTTEKYSADTVRRLKGTTKDIIIGLLGFVPVVGPYVSAGGFAYTVYNDIFGKNPKNKWYTIKEYCTRGYEYYAWKTYTYTDSHRNHLQSVKWEYKKVL